MPLTNHNYRGQGYRSEGTTVANNSNHWAQVSSPESSPEPETEPIVATLLARFKRAPEMDLVSPEPEEREEEQLPVYTVVESEEEKRRSSQNSALRLSRISGVRTSEERLQEMPKLRELPWREGVDPTSEHEVGGESRRKQIRFGCLLATRGIVQDNPCATCANGRGKFSLCIALDGFFKGACASCQLSGGPNRCTIKKNDDELPNSSANNPTEKPLQSMAKRPSLGYIKRPSSDTPQPNKRRRKTEDQDARVERADKIPEWESARPQWQQELGDSQARQQLSQDVRSPWATVNQPTPATVPVPTPVPIQQLANNSGTNGGQTNLQYSTDRRASAGWAAVNQPTTSHPGPSRGYYNPDAGASYQISPGGYQMSGSSHQNSAAGYKRNGVTIPNNEAENQSVPLHSNNQEQPKREDTVPADEGSVTLIDSLPKHKQRQLYGLVSGLQGGIKHLQTELDALKKALGIDD